MEFLSVVRAGESHCKGDLVPTLRPLLAVTGPPRQSGRSPVLWPLAGLQRPRPQLKSSPNRALPPTRLVCRRLDTGYMCRFARQGGWRFSRRLALAAGSTVDRTEGPAAEEQGGQGRTVRPCCPLPGASHNDPRSIHLGVAVHVLAERRASKGWKKVRLLLELKRAAVARGITVASDESLDRMVREWEAGRRPLVGDYLTLFCDVYACTPMELGHFPSDAEDPDQDDISIMRRELLSAASADPGLVQLLESQTENLRQMDRRVGAAALLPQIEAHVSQMEVMLKNSISIEARRLTARALSDAAALAGWQALDLGRYRDSWNLHEVAKNAAREADDPSLLTHATAQQAYVLIDLGNHDQAVQLVQQARSLGSSATPALMTAWLRAAEAEAHAVAGSETECRRALEEADAALPTDSADTDLPFLFLAGSHLARWRGNCLARLGAEEAIEDLIQALSTMEAGFNRAEAGLECDLAGAFLVKGDLSEAHKHATRAKELAALTGSIRQRRRIESTLRSTS